MIKFEEHDDRLFRMLDKPVPLTPDAEMPCLVRLIQDDSPMGRYNRDAAYFDVIGKLFVAQKIKENPFYSNTLHAYEKNSLNQDYCIASIHTLEIIGYQAEEGSRWWALYQMMQGEKICHHKSPSIRYLDQNKRVCLVSKNGDVYQGAYSPEDWLYYVESTNCWEIYEEPKPEPKPKPLLADSRVGDLCRRRDGKWVQIDRLLSIGGMPWICYEIGGLRYINNGEQLNSKLSELGIISTEPLAPEGTAEWAWQMMLLGEKICHKKSPSIMYCKHASEIMRQVRYNCVDYMSASAWLNGADKNGWQLYKEPEPEPPREPEYVICKRCGGTGYEIREPKPESENIIHGHIPADMRLKYIDLGRYKVGDWVEWCGDQYMIESAPPQSGGRYDIRSPYDELGCSVYPENITRKLSPSEVIVHIGCLSGTVEDLSYASDGRFWLIGKATERRQQGMFALLYDEMLDTETRNIVEGLLKAQMEEEEND